MKMVLPDCKFFDLIFFGAFFYNRKQFFNTVLTLNEIFYTTDHVVLIM